ncbi:ribosomal protein S6 kinase 2 beta-like isoform 2-T2 [Anomaloglossus baeobatrachus]
MTFAMNKAKMDFLKEKRTQRDRVLKERRGLNEEQEPIFALGRKDFILPDMDTVASEMASKRQNLDKMRKNKRHDFLTEKRKMETPSETHSAASAELQKAIHSSLRKLGELAPEIRRRNKDAILNKRMNICAEIELEEDLQERPSHVTSESESEDTLNLQRAAAQKRIKNNRDWAVQCRRRLIYAKPIINGNGGLCRPQSSAKTISIPEFLFQLSVSSPDRSLDKEEPDGSVEMALDTAGTPVEDLGDVRCKIFPMQELIDPENPIDLCNLEHQTELGQGGYGKVLLAKDPATEELLAVKIMDKSYCTGEVICTEIHVLGLTAECPYLMSLRAYMETPIEYIIAMEYMAGGDLLQHMTQLMPYDIKTVRRFAAEMVCGLQFLHEHGVIHCDLKPDNVLINENGHIKITDFGLSAVNVGEDDLLHDFVGAKGHIPPEIMNGEDGYNNRADSFAFGVILYTMLLGKNPFYSTGTLEEYHQSLQEDNPEFPPGICSDAINLIEGLLRKDRYTRFAITSSIREHPFFHSINWREVETGMAKAPFQQNLSDGSSETSSDTSSSDTSSSDMSSSDMSSSNMSDPPVQHFGGAISSISPERQVLIPAKKTLNVCDLEFQRVLAKGSFGNVMLASDPATEELLAVKIMKKGRYTEAMKTTEVNVLKTAIGCRYLISFRGVQETPMEYKIAMDYMARGDLHGHMAQLMTFDAETTRRFAAEMVCGIQYLHEHGIVHRDLKPQNVLLDDTGHITISDFGLAVEELEEDEKIKGFAGTKGYTAPEIMDGESYNHLVDSFSFGVILYMMVVGEKPFYSRGTKKEYHKSLKEDSPYFPPGASLDTINFIEGLLCKNPLERIAVTSTIRQHPYFSSINWRDVESGRADPPFQ